MKIDLPESTWEGPPRLRHSVRALILDEADHVLLVRFYWDGFETPDGFWANPGGGIEPGESRLEALQRELREEIGLEVCELGPEVWTKTAFFRMQSPDGAYEWDGQVDHIYLCRTTRFEPTPLLSPEALAAEGLREVRWWAPSELHKGVATFAPRALPELLARLLVEGVPATPLEFEGY